MPATESVADCVVNVPKYDCDSKVLLLQETTPPRAIEKVTVAPRRSGRQASKQRVPLSSDNGLTTKRLRYSQEKEDVKRDVPKEERISVEEPRVPESESMSSEDDSDSKDEQEYPEHTPGGLSAYELKRLENIRTNQAFLSALSLPQITASLKKPTQRGLKKEKAKSSVKEALPVRKSMRLQKKEAEPLALAVQPAVTQEREQWVSKPAGPIAMVPVNMEDGSQLPAALLDLWREKTAMVEKEKLSLKGYTATLKKMKLSAERVVKVVKDRIFSAAFHPSSSRLLAAAGDKWGRVGLWDLEGGWGDDGVLLFEPHSRPVCCMAFSHSHPTSLLSVSYDGTLRGTDINKAVFDEVYRSDIGLAAFDFLSHDCSTLLVCDWEGDVAVVDRRTPGTSHSTLSTLDTRTLRCVHVHPVQKQYFVASETRDAHIYDIRCLQRRNNKPVSSLLGHSLSVSSAYFSPSTGNRVLTTCMDNNIRVFDTSEFKSQAPLLCSIRHDMQTGRWLTKLRAVWDPKQEDCFAIGSMQRPRRMLAFHESGQLVHTFQDEEHLSTVCSVAAFHPSRNALLGANCSGRLHVFTG
ncbi:WD repeat-containing protein 76 [Megalops cyprinoides]|uniref:WD repeat-containing protein 76 n=1 Tax=Megalops cyprinoides TaxID=118141 RepID=UPI001863C999|nr:WD repeat-containing protein 76 [Megalops cyprinoides]